MEQLGLPVDIHSEQDADVIIDYIRENTFKQLKLYEYKVIDVAKQADVIRKALKDRSEQSSHPTVYHNVYNMDIKKRIALFGQDVIVNGHLGTRFHKKVHISAALSFLLAFNKIKSLDEVSDDQVDGLVESFKNLLNDYNLPLYEEYDEECKVALENIKGRLLFTRLAENGPKLGRIAKK